MSKPQLRLIEASFHERPVTLRLPFRFGVVTLTEAPQAFVRARIKLADGREGEGVSAELLVPKWFDKSPALTNEDNFNQLRRSLKLARGRMLDAEADTAFGLSASVEAGHHAACAQAGLNGLVASFGLALIERAIIDALGRLEGASVFELTRANRLGLTAATATDLAGFDFDAFLSGLAPAPSIFARHTVGLVDALTRAETAGKRLDDGLPESLEEVIAAYGHHHFKLKVAGSLDADIDRLSRIAAVLDRIQDPYFATLDGNEQFENADSVIALWRRIGAEPRLTRLKSAILFVEQPIARAKALAEPVHALASEVAVEIDEFRRRHGRVPCRARARISRHLGQILQGLLSRPVEPGPDRTLECRSWSGPLFHVGRGPHHAGRRRRAAGPCTRNAGRRHARRAQRSPLRRWHGRSPGRGTARIPLRTP